MVARVSASNFCPSGSGLFSSLLTRLLPRLLSLLRSRLRSRRRSLSLCLSRLLFLSLLSRSRSLSRSLPRSLSRLLSLCLAPIFIKHQNKKLIRNTKWQLITKCARKCHKMAILFFKVTNTIVNYLYMRIPHVKREKFGSAVLRRLNTNYWQERAKCKLNQHHVLSLLIQYLLVT